jgi:hypothetical protein
MGEFIIKYWLEVAFVGVIGIASALYGKLMAKFKKQNTESEAIKLGMTAILRDRIIQEYNKYINEGEIPIYALENVEKMFHAYTDLGGNGIIRGCVDELGELPKPKKNIGA